MAVKVELCGRLIKSPALRVTPAGAAVAHMIVDCGERPGELAIAVVMAGEAARRVAASFKDGQSVKVRGMLRVLAGNNREGGMRASRLEVLADEIKAPGCKLRN